MSCNQIPGLEDRGYNNAKCPPSRTKNGVLIAAVVSSMALILSGVSCHHQSPIPPPPVPTLEHVLQTADWVDIGDVHVGQKWEHNRQEWDAVTLRIDKPSKLFPRQADQNPKMLLLLRSTNQFHRMSPHGQYDFEFDILSYDGIPRVEDMESYQYFSRTGELGRDNEWCYVPAEFKAWMLKVKAELPKRQPSHQ